MFVMITVWKWGCAMNMHTLSSQVVQFVRRIFQRGRSCLNVAMLSHVLRSRKLNRFEFDCLVDERFGEARGEFVLMFDVIWYVFVWISDAVASAFKRSIQWSGCRL